MVTAIGLRSDCVVGKTRSVYNAITSPARGVLLSLTARFSHTIAHARAILFEEEMRRAGEPQPIAADCGSRSSNAT